MKLYDVMLHAIPKGRTAMVVRALREERRLDLRAAGGLADALPARLYQKRPEAEARATCAWLEGLGARATVEHSGTRCFCVDVNDVRRGDQGLSWIELDVVTRRTSFIGPQQREIDTHATAALAVTAFDALVARQRSLGWAVVDDEVAAHAALCARDREIEAAIAADPDDDDLYGVYADWLQQQGDQRGELIALQLARAIAERGNPEQSLGQAERVLLSRHDGHLLGDIAWSARQREVSLTWSCGFVRAAEIRPAQSEPRALAHLLRALFALPVSLLLERVTLPDGAFAEPFSWGLCGAALPDNVAELVVGDGRHASERWGDVPLDELWHTLTGLTRLQLACARAIVPEGAGLLRLRELVLRMRDTPFECIARIATLDMPALESLELRCAEQSQALPRHLRERHRWLDYDYDPYEEQPRLGAEELLPLLRCKRWPLLRRLELHELRCGDTLAEALAQTPMVGQLEVLVLRDVGIGDSGARVIAENGARFVHLEALHLEGNVIGKRGERALRRALGAVAVVGTQHKR